MSREKRVIVKRLLLALLAGTVAVMLVIGTVYFRSTQVIELPIPLTPDNNSPGVLCKAEQVGNFGTFAFRSLLWWADLPEGVSVHNGAKLYRLKYWTKRYDGVPTVASGLVAIPTVASFRGVVSYQHGTNTNRHATPSQPSLGEGVLGAAIFSGAGYLFVAPDYVGLGASPEIHTYLHAESTANTVIDLLRAANRFTEWLHKQWPESLYLIGFSQGGHATLAAQRMLETMNDPMFRVVASAPVSGAYDLSGISFPTALAGSSSADSLYLAYLLNSYCRVYGRPIESVLTAAYARTLPELFDGEHSGDEISAALPRTPREMFNAEFLQNYESGKPTWLLDALASNQVLQWSPRAPLRLYFGENDADVSPKEAQAAVTEFSKRGCDATLASVGACGHEESILRAVPKIRKWFDELSAKSAPSN